ncbi:MAG: hypothetical protein Q8936_24890, partial [Bacillota bacterium]|nr:hypothetical protein [Bacillota bacterium]
KKKRLPRVVVLLGFFVILINYGWELYSTDWTHSLARLPNVILFLLAGLFGIFIYFPRKDK